MRKGIKFFFLIGMFMIPIPDRPYLLNDQNDMWGVTISSHNSNNSSHNSRRKVTELAKFITE